MLYFAYGSNLNRQQMKERCPSSKIYGLGVLRGYDLTFCGHSEKRKGSIASIEPKAQSCLEGVLYHIDPIDLMTLDYIEDYPTTYVRDTFTIVTSEDKSVSAIVYFQIGSEKSLPDFEYVKTIFNEYVRLGFNQKTLLEALRDVLPENV